MDDNKQQDNIDAEENSVNNVKNTGIKDPIDQGQPKQSAEKNSRMDNNRESEYDNSHDDDQNHSHHDDAHRLDIKSLSLEETKGKPLYRVKIISSNETIMSILEPGVEVAVNDYVVATTRYGKDLGIIQCGPCKNEVNENMDIYPVHRKASESDLSKYESHHEKEKQAFKICQEKIDEHNLEMKLVTTHYLLEELKILFFFTAENRVDFRELVKDLVSIFKMRIELRQIGVRDEARVVGGIGICGRNFCCHSVNDKLNPVSIKMAKEQNISLNSLKISGPCGRLLCCLGYEYDFYHKEKSCLPDEGRKFVIANEDYYVHELNVLVNKIVLRGTSGRMLSLPVHVFKKDINGEWRIDKNVLEDHVEKT